MKALWSGEAAQRNLIAFWFVGLALLTLALAFIFSVGKGKLLLLAISAAVGGGVLLLRPHWAVYLLLSFLFLEVSIPLFGVRYLGIHYLLSALLLVPLAFSILRDRDIWILHLPQIKIFLALSGLFLISTWWSHFKYPVTLLPEADRTVRMLELFFSRLVFLVFFLYFVKTRGRIEAAVWLLVALIVAGAVSALLYPTPTQFDYEAGVVRPQRAQAAFSLGENPNRFAFMCLFGTAILWFFQSFAPSNPLKIATLPLLLFLPAMALGAGSRSGFLQLLILAGLIFKEQQGWSATKRMISFFFLGCVALALVLVVPAGQLMRATTFEQSVSTAAGHSSESRLRSLAAAVELAASDPIFGVGIGNFRWLHRAYYGRNLETHNSYLWALTSGGIGALFLYLAMFYITFRMLRATERRCDPEILWLVKGLKAGLILFFGFSIFADFWLHLFIYLIIGLTIALNRLSHARRHRAAAPAAVWRPATA